MGAPAPAAPAPRALRRWLEARLLELLKVSELRDLVARSGVERDRAFVARLLAELEIEPVTASAPRPAELAEGPLVFVANHALGGPDALVGLHELMRFRPDLLLLTNRALAGFLGPIRDHVVHVQPPSTTKGRDNSAARDAIRAHLRAGGAVAAAPAGQVARRDRRWRLQEGAWRPGLGHLIQETGADVAPVAFEGANRASFHLLSALHWRLGSKLLVRELFARRGTPVRMHIGARIPNADLVAPSPRELMADLRARALALLGP